MMLFPSPLEGLGLEVGSLQLHCLRPLTASLAEGPTAAAAVPAAGGGSACGLRLPPPPPLGPPLRDPGGQKAPPVRGLFTGAVGYACVCTCACILSHVQFFVPEQRRMAVCV